MELNTIKIFISYRRTDSPGHAGRLGDALRHKFGKQNVFKDVTDIRGGAHFPSVISQAIKGASVMVVTIGPGWSGKRLFKKARVFDDTDWIRQEIETALASGTHILPVLVNGGEMPDKNQLPETLAFFADLNGVAVRDSKWEEDIEDLYNEVEQLSKLPPLPVSTNGGKGVKKKKLSMVVSLIVSLCIILTIIYFITRQETPQQTRFYHNVESILYKVKFNSPVDTVMKYEWGQTYPNFYDSLPVAGECKENVVKYYWRFMNESPLGRGVLNFFESKGLKNYINDNSYVIYSFKDNKLVKVDLRIFSGVKNFYEDFIKALGLNPINFPSKYISHQGNFFYIAGNNHAESSYHLVIANQQGYTLCSNDWWNN